LGFPADFKGKRLYIPEQFGKIAPTLADRSSNAHSSILCLANGVVTYIHPPDFFTLRYTRLMRKSDFIFRYRMRNWPAYNRALVRRGSITFWVDENAVST